MDYTTVKPENAKSCALDPGHVGVSVILGIRHGEPFLVKSVLGWDFEGYELIEVEYPDCSTKVIRSFQLQNVREITEPMERFLRQVEQLKQTHRDTTTLQSPGVQAMMDAFYEMDQAEE